MRSIVIVTCEHGGNEVPRAYRSAFRSHRELLRTHRGWDIGALAIARRLARATDSSLTCSTTTRLLVDLNRSIGNPKLFSEISRPFDAEIRQRILAEHYRPYRSEVEERIRNGIAQAGRVVHLSIHTFTPVMNGQTRSTEIGLLYDPSRPGERAICDMWKRVLCDHERQRIVRRNDPYRGVADGFVTHLRRQFSACEYIGIELEVNQRFAVNGGGEWLDMQRLLAESFVQILDRRPD